MTKITQKPDGSVTFELIIPKETIATEYQKVLLETSKTVIVKGFRPGKAPLSMVESQTDKSQLYSRVLDHVLSPAYSAVIHEHKLIPLIEPRVTPKTMELGKDWVMAVELAVSPEITLTDYQKQIKSALKKHPKNKHKDEKEESDHRLNIVFDTLLSETKFAVAPLLIEEETKSALSRLANQLQSLKLSVADYAKSIKKTPDELIAEYKKSAESNLKLEFILQKIVESKSPVVTDAELAALKPPKGQEVYAKYVLQKRKVLDFLTAL